MELTAELQRAIAAVRQAFVVLRRHAAAPVQFEHKADGGLVTAADRDVDALLRGLLPEPGDGWLSEESPDDHARLAARRVWIVDPLDGTRAFVARRPEFSVSVALVVDGEPRLGVVGNPATDVLIAGAVGHGVQCDGDATLPFEDRLGADRPRLLVSRSEWKRGEWQRWQHVAQVVPLGSIAYQLALIAAGAADASWTVHPKHEWDVAAGAALVRAAGGELWLPRGGHLRWNRSRPRFLSFGVAGPGQRERLARLNDA